MLQALLDEQSQQREKLRKQQTKLQTQQKKNDIKERKKTRL